MALGSADGRAVLDRYRQVVSGAHLAGAKVITNEWGAVLFGQFAVRPQDLKALADRSLAAGVTRMALHGFAYRLYDRAAGIGPGPAWPGWCAWCGGGLEFSDSWDQRWPQFKSLRGLADYLGRAGAALRDGRPRVDLTLLNAASVVNGIGAPSTAGTPEDSMRRALGRRRLHLGCERPGRHPPSGRGPRVAGCCRRGPGYKALVVDTSRRPAGRRRRAPRPARARRLPIVVYGSAAGAGAGYKERAGRGRQGESRGQQSARFRSVRFARSPAGLLAALRALAVRPDFRARRRRDAVVPVHRRTAAGDLWFLYNDSPEAVAGKFELRDPRRALADRSLERSGNPAAGGAQVGGARRCGSTCSPGQTTLLSFDRRRGARTGRRPVFIQRRLSGPLTVAGPWKLRRQRRSPRAVAPTLRPTLCGAQPLGVRSPS